MKTQPFVLTTQSKNLGDLRRVCLHLVLSFSFLATIVTAQEPGNMTGNMSHSLLANPVGYVFDHHIEGVGLVLWGAEAYTGKRGLFGDVRSDISKGIPDPVLKVAGLDVLDRFALVARLQNSLDVDETKAQAATYQWISDADTGDFWNLDAAVILDWYFPGGPLTELIAYRPDSLAAHLRTGFAWERVTSGSSALSTDLREIFVGVGFRPGPIDRVNLKQLQKETEFQIGISYKEDAAAGSSQWSTDFNVQPVFKDIFPFAIGENVFLKRKSTASTLDQEVKAEENPSKAGTSPLEHVGDYFYIKPNFTLKSVFNDFSRNRSTDAGDYQFDWGARFGFGFFNDALRFSYQLTGVTPLQRAENSFVFQEARAEYRPNINAPLIISARYTKGERAPSFVAEDRITLAVGIKF